jgi:hypothetical protein
MGAAILTGLVFRAYPALKAALADHPEDAWTDGVITQVGAAFFAAVRRNGHRSSALGPRPVAGARNRLKTLMIPETRVSPDRLVN